MILALAPAADAVTPLTSANVTYSDSDSGQTIVSIDGLNFNIEALDSFAVTTYNKPLTMKDTGVDGTVYSSGTPTIAHQDYIRDLDIDTAWSFGNDTTEPYNGAFEANLTTSMTASIASELNEVALILFESGSGDAPIVQAYNGATALGTALEVTGSNWGDTGATSFAFSAGQDSVAVGLSLSDLGVTVGQEVTGFTFTATRNWDVTEIMVDSNLTSVIPGDADRDGDVDLNDGGILTGNFGNTTGQTWDDGDFDGDGDVDLDDGSILVGNWGTGVPDTAGVNGEAEWDFDATVAGLSTTITVDATLMAFLSTEGLDGAILTLDTAAVPFSTQQLGPGVQVGELLGSNFISGTETIGVTVGSEGIYEFEARWNVLGGTEQSATFSINFVPEPATMSLLAIGGLGVLLKRRRRRA